MSDERAPDPSPWQATNNFVAAEGHVHRLAADRDGGFCRRN